MFLREYGDVFNIHLVKHFMFDFNRMISCVISASLSVGLDGKSLFFDHECVFFNTGVLLSGLYQFSALNPGCFICMILR
jgi:hypothetical protein